MSYSFRDAYREGVSLLISLAGASGSGKTRSALRMAGGIVGGDMSKVYLVDTEARRGLHHADLFTPRFKHLDMQPPFKPQRFEDAIQAAIDAGAGCVVCDSFSDEYEGEGGLIEWADSGKSANGAANWKDPKLAHKRFLNFVRQVRIPLIFCLRAEERVKIEPDPEKPGKNRIVPLGWMPVCEKRWMYDMTLSLTLAPETKGRPRPDLPGKVPDFAIPWFDLEQMIGEEAGAALAAWARGEGQAPAREKEGEKSGPDGWPMLAPDASLKSAPDAEQWVRWCRAAVAKLPDTPDLDQWCMSMEPHFVALANFDADAVQQVKRAAGDRRSAIIQARTPE